MGIWEWGVEFSGAGTSKEGLEILVDSSVGAEFRKKAEEIPMIRARAGTTKINTRRINIIVVRCLYIARKRGVGDCAAGTGAHGFKTWLPLPHPKSRA
jgi:hypothetical protein